MIFSDLEKEEIDQIISENINNAKKKLAFLVTSDCHSEDAAKEAENKSISIFEKNSFESLDEIHFKKDMEVNILDGLVDHKLVSSKSEAKRLIEGGGIKIEENQIKDFNFILHKTYQDQVLKIGKKKLFKIKFS